MCESSFFKYVFLILTSFYLPSGIHCQESYKCSGDLRNLSIFNHLLSPSPIQLSHCGLEVTFSLYTDLIHVQVVFAVQTATRLGTVRDMALFKRGKSYLDFFAPARVFFHSFAFIQGGFTSSPSYIQSFMEVLLALHFAIIQGGFTSSPSCIQSFMEVLLALHHSIIQGGFTSSPSCIQSFMEVLLALHHSIIQGGFTISPSSISDLLLRVHESGNSSRICHPLDR